MINSTRFNEKLQIGIPCGQKKVLLVATNNNSIIVSSSPNNISVSTIVVGEFLSAKELLS